jgi:hypothetical protein
LWLPLSLVLASAVVFAMFVVAQRHRYTRELEHFANSTAHAELLETQRALETVLRRGDGSGTEGVVSHLGLNPVIAYAALLGPDGKVVAATRFAWKGQPAAGLVPGFTEESARQVREAQREFLSLDRAQLRLTALAPVTLALQPGEMRATRQGLLWIDYDLRPVAAQTWGQIHRQGLALAAAVLLAALGLLELARQGRASCGRWRHCASACSASALATIPIYPSGAARVNSVSWGTPWNAWRPKSRRATRHWPRARPAFASCLTLPSRRSSCTRAGGSPMPTLPPSG